MKNEIAVFGGGCFWCTEAVFKMLRSVSAVLPGYAGGPEQLSPSETRTGKQATPTYEEVSGGKTGYVEVIKIEFNPADISFRDLLTVFFASHDPTTQNRQGNDVGTQYRSAIFYTSSAQKKEAEDFVTELNASNEYGKPIITEIKPLERFFEAENYHRDYFTKNPENPYCELVINPKLEKVQQTFAELLKTRAS